MTLSRVVAKKSVLKLVPTTPPTQEERIAQLEARLAKLESFIIEKLIFSGEEEIELEVVG